MYISEMFNGEVRKTQVSVVEFKKCYDVIVSGLGTAGAPAAAMAAQNGLKVLGIEYFNCAGGTTTIGGIQYHYFGMPGGRYEEMDVRTEEYKQAYFRNNIECKKIVMEDIMTESGAEILYESSICGVYLEDNAVVGVRVITPDGFCDIGCRVLMDCTGDAHTAHMAGCKSEFGRELDGLPQPYSMVSVAKRGVTAVNTNYDFGRVDQRNDEELSRALIFSRSYEMAEDRSEGKLLVHMPLIGVREGRRIISEENINLKDIFAGNFTKTPMFYSYADLDKHGWDIAFDGELLGDWAIGANLGAYNLVIPISYKSIIPKEIDGILVPCRGLGVDRDISSAVRMMLDMKKVAEGAADIAMLALKHNCKLCDVPYDELSEMLKKTGCLKNVYTVDYRIDGRRDIDGNPLVIRDVHWITEPEKLEEGLSGIKPGEAIWSAKRMGGKAIPVLKELIKSRDENTKKHAAFALALLEDKSSIDILREMAWERDPVMLRDCRKHNQYRGCMAIYLLGRLGDAEITDTLTEIITDPDELKHEVYNLEFNMSTRYEMPDFNNEYFQFVSEAVIALIRIADIHSGLRKSISEAFKTAFDDESYIKRITTRPVMSSEGGMAVNIKNVAFAAVKRWGV